MKQILKSPGVVLLHQFDTKETLSKKQNKKSVSFSKFIDYESKMKSTSLEKNKFTNHENDVYSKYIEYESKSKNAFTKNDYVMDKEVFKEYKRLYDMALNNGSPIHKIVLSFTDEWLKSVGLLDSNNVVRHNTLIDYARNSISALQDSEVGLEHYIYTGGVHYDTNHVHIHISLVNPNPNDERLFFCKSSKQYEIRGKFKNKSLEKMKSTFVNQAMKTAGINGEINDLIRNQINQREKIKGYISGSEDLRNELIDVVKNLPSNKRLWKYNMNALNYIRDDIDAVSEKLINRYFKDDYEVLDSKLEEISKLYNMAYGENRGEDFIENKKQELKAKLGNTLLKELASAEYLHQLILNKNNRATLMDVDEATLIIVKDMMLKNDVLSDKEIKNLFKKAFKNCKDNRKMRHVKSVSNYEVNKIIFMIGKSLRNVQQDYLNELAYMRDQLEEGYFISR